MMGKVKITQPGQDDIIIDNVIELEQFMGDRAPITDICGSPFTYFICSQCADKGIVDWQNGCGKVFVVGYIKNNLQEIWVKTVDGERVFCSDDIEFKVLDW